MIRVIQKNQKVIVILLSSLIALSMLSFGVDYSGTGKTKYAIKVDKQEFSFEDFEIERNQIMNQLQSMYGKFYPQLLKSGGINIKQMTVDRIINTALLTEAANKYGFAVGDQQLAKQIAEQLGGNLDANSYRDFLVKNNQNATSFEARLRESTRIMQLAEILQDASQVSDAELKTVIKQDLAKYDLQYLEFDPQNYLSQVTVPNDEELKKIFEENVTKYEIPEQVKYDFITIAPDAAKANVKIAPEDIELYYSEHIAKFTEPESVKLSVIKLVAADTNPEELAKVKVTAEKVHSEILAGKKFSEAAKENSKDPSASAGGDLGWVTRKSIPSDLAEIYFSSSAMGLTKPIESGSNYYILEVQDYREEKVKALADVKAEIENILIEQDAPAYAVEMALDLHSSWQASKQSLTEFAASKGLVVKNTELLSAEKDPSPELKGLSAKVLQDVNNKQQQFELGNFNVLVEVKEYKEKYYPDFAAVKEQVVLEQKNKLAEKAAKVAAEAALKTEQTDLAKLQLTPKVQLQTKNDFALNKPEPGVLSAPDLRNVIQAAPMSKPSSLIEEAGKFYLLQVKAVKFPKDEEVTGKLAEYRTQFKNSDGEMLLQSFLASQKAKSQIDVDPSLLVNSQDA